MRQNVQIGESDRRGCEALHLFGQAGHPGVEAGHVAFHSGHVVPHAGFHIPQQGGALRQRRRDGGLGLCGSGQGVAQGVGIVMEALQGQQAGQHHGHLRGSRVAPLQRLVHVLLPGVGKTPDTSFPVKKKLGD